MLTPNSVTTSVHIIRASHRLTRPVPAQNGLPFFHNALSSNAELAGTQLVSVDPGGALLRHFDPRNRPVAACVTHIAVERTSPNEVLCTSPLKIVRFTVGCASGGAAAQPLQRLVQMMRQAGLNAFVVRPLRSCACWRHRRGVHFRSGGALLLSRGVVPLGFRP